LSCFYSKKDNKFVIEKLDFITKIVFFTLKIIFESKNAGSDTKSTFSVTLI